MVIKLTTSLGVLQKDANVFIVNWERGAVMLNYKEAASNTRVVGAVVARSVNLKINQE